MSERHTSSRPESARMLSLVEFILLLLAFGSSLAWTPVTIARQQSYATGTVTIVLPDRVVAGEPATLAVLDADGRLAPGVTVNLGDDHQQVTTDRTGRALFTVASSAGVLLASASGASSAALVDSGSAAESRQTVTIALVVSLHEPFSVCGTGLRGNADSNQVRINGQPALVMAASPECLTVLPGPKAEPGPAQISVEAAPARWTANTTLVSLESESPKPALLPGKKGSLIVRVHGSDRRLRILVENQTPGVLRFPRGDMQDLLTSGGSPNLASVEIQAIRSGDFSFDARVLPVPDADAARRYLLAAQPLAPRNLGNDVAKLAGKLSGHPRDFGRVRRELDRIRVMTFAGDFRTLLDAARAAL